MKGALLAAQCLFVGLTNNQRHSMKPRQGLAMGITNKRTRYPVRVTAWNWQQDTQHNLKLVGSAGPQILAGVLDFFIPHGLLIKRTETFRSEMSCEVFVD
jgi:hypothetical protein